MGQKYNVTDGKLVLTLEEAREGGFTVTSPIEPALITEADSISEAFEMARDALRAIAASRADPDRWKKATVPVRKPRKSKSRRRSRLVAA
jgi:predicted RNase H-like HicB family nuclease